MKEAPEHEAAFSVAHQPQSDEIDIVAIGPAGVSQNIQAEHPGHEAQGDNGHDDVPEPLPSGFRFGSVFHGVMVSGVLIKPPAFAGVSDYRY
jgi:hypothetical protein